MSMHDEIAAHVAAGVLLPYQPQLRMPMRRRLFLTRDAMQLLRDPHSAVGLLGGRGPIEDAMNRWVRGERVNGRRIAGTLRGGLLYRLAPPPPEIWEMRITEPVVRWRVFARFAEPDTLIATTIRSRTLLGRRGSRGWTEATLDCERAWQQLFPTTMPFAGTRARDYITENCDDFEL